MKWSELTIVDKELYKSIIAHRERFSKLGGVNYALHFPPNLNPIPPAAFMPEWERDYAEVQGQMIAGESIPFDVLIQELKRIKGIINSSL